MYQETATKAKKKLNGSVVPLAKKVNPSSSSDSESDSEDDEVCLYCVLP